LLRYSSDLAIRPREFRVKRRETNCSSETARGWGESSLFRVETSLAECTRPRARTRAFHTRLIKLPSPTTYALVARVIKCVRASSSNSSRGKETIHRLVRKYTRRSHADDVHRKKESARESRRCVKLRRGASARKPFRNLRCRITSKRASANALRAIHVKVRHADSSWPRKTEADRKSSPYVVPYLCSSYVCILLTSYY
jgi:hypothetical protein